MRDGAGLNLARHLNRAREPMTGGHRAANQEWSGVLTGAGTTPAHTSVHAKCPLWPLLLHNSSPLGQRLQLQRKVQTVEDRVGSNLAQHPDRERAPLLAFTEAADHKQSVALTGARTIQVWAPASTGCPIQPLWFQHCSPRSKGADVGRGEQHTLKVNRTNSDPTLRVSAPAIWDLTPFLIGQCWQLRSGEDPACICLWLQPLHVQPHLLPR